MGNNKWIALGYPSQIDNMEELDGVFEDGQRIQFKTTDHRVINATFYYRNGCPSWLDAEEGYTISTRDRQFLLRTDNPITHYRER